MIFAVQRSQPRHVNGRGMSAEDLSEALGMIAPFNTEQAYMQWNHVHIPMDYKYDVPVFIFEVSALLNKILTTSSAENVHLMLGSNTFRSAWNISWNEKEIHAKADWQAVSGDIETLLNSRPSITVSKSQFIAEWGGLFLTVKDLILSSGIRLRDSAGFDAMLGVLGRITEPGVLYTKRDNEFERL